MPHILSESKNTLHSLLVRISIYISTHTMFTFVYLRTLTSLTLPPCVLPVPLACCTPYRINVTLFPLLLSYTRFLFPSVFLRVSCIFLLARVYISGSSYNVSRLACNLSSTLFTSFSVYFSLFFIIISSVSRSLFHFSSLFLYFRRPVWP